MAALKDANPIAARTKARETKAAIFIARKNAQIAHLRTIPGLRGLNFENTIQAAWEMWDRGSQPAPPRPSEGTIRRRLREMRGQSHGDKLMI